MTRLRTQVVNPDLINEELLKKVSNKGLVKNGNEIQLIIGLKVQDVLDAVKPVLKLDD